MAVGSAGCERSAAGVLAICTLPQISFRPGEAGADSGLISVPFRPASRIAPLGAVPGSRGGQDPSARQPIETVVRPGSSSKSTASSLGQLRLPSCPAGGKRDSGNGPVPGAFPGPGCLIRQPLSNSSPEWEGRCSGWGRADSDRRQLPSASGPDTCCPRAS